MIFYVLDVLNLLIRLGWDSYIPPIDKSQFSGYLIQFTHPSDLL